MIVWLRDVVGDVQPRTMASVWFPDGWEEGWCWRFSDEELWWMHEARKGFQACRGQWAIEMTFRVGKPAWKGVKRTSSALRCLIASGKMVNVLVGVVSV